MEFRYVCMCHQLEHGPPLNEDIELLRKNLDFTFSIHTKYFLSIFTKITTM